MLAFESAAKVGVGRTRKILEECQAISRTWWRDPLGFETEEGDSPQILRGRVALFHASGVREEDDLFMAFADAAFIVERLRDWAARFGVKWRLRMHDEDWGYVDPMGCSRDLLDPMNKWARRVQVPSRPRGGWIVLPDRQAQLLGRYPGRR